MFVNRNFVDNIYVKDIILNCIASFESIEIGSLFVIDTILWLFSTESCRPSAVCVGGINTMHDQPSYCGDFTGEIKQLLYAT